MPVTKKNAQKKVAPKKEETPEVYYKELTIEEYSTDSEHGPLTVSDAKEMLGWETEESYKKRMVEEDPNSKPEEWIYGDVFHCIDSSGKKVRCWRNANNRPFDVNWCKDLGHTILYGQWAGPLTIPGETINGETVRIGRYRRVLSGQHQLTALILANEILQLQRADENPASPKFPFWAGKKECVIETIVVKGLSEDERVLRTIDYVKPRTMADVLFTMPLYRDNNPGERKELTRMLAAAVELLWDRTATKGYKTHTEMVEFLNRHKKLLACVEHLFSENTAKGAEGGRRISKLRLSAGQMAAICYLMGSSGPKTDGDKYRNMKPPAEKGLDWSPWDKAREFWVRLASGRSFDPVREALARLLDSSPENDQNEGLGGRSGEKLAILSRAWERWKDHPGIAGDDGDAGPPFAQDDLEPGGQLDLEYINTTPVRTNSKGELVGGKPLPNGMVRLVSFADFGGIDHSKVTGGAANPDDDSEFSPDDPTPEELDAATERIRQEREEKKEKKKADKRKSRKSKHDEEE